MLGARIDIIQPQIRNLVFWSCWHCQTKKTMTAVRDKTSGLNRNDHQTWSRLQHTLLIWKGSITYCLLLLWACRKISCISQIYCVWHNVCVHVCKTINWQFISYHIVYTVLWLIVAGINCKNGCLLKAKCIYIYLIYIFIMTRHGAFVFTITLHLRHDSP